MSLYTTELKKGDFVRIAVRDGWETSEFAGDRDWETHKITFF